MPEELSFELPTDKWDIVIPENSPLNYEIAVDFYKWNLNEAVIIIVWKWWTTHGYKDKYVTIASNLVKNHWVNVFVVENPWISWDDPELYFDSAMKFIIDKMEKLWYKDYKFYGMGFSAWGYFMCRCMNGINSYSHLFKKLLIINPYLQENFDDICHWMMYLACPIIFIQWEYDDYSIYNEKLDKFCRIQTEIWDDFQLFTLPWVDHQFTQKGGLELFISLPEKYLFNDTISPYKQEL